MLPQYKMVLINGILSIILLLGLIIYKYLLKRKINLFYLLILISILPIVSIFRIGSYESGDLSLHVKRLISFYNLLINYHLIPRWTPEFNSGYGDPNFLFAYFLFYLIGSIFHLIGFSFLMSLKLLLAFSFVISGLTMFFWVRDELGEKPGFVAAIFYLFIPYHLVDIHFRVSIAENLSFVFLPLIMLAIKRFIESGKNNWLGVLSISVASLILSHQVIALIFSPMIILYSLFVLLKVKKSIKSLIYCIIPILFGLLISAFYWLPIVFLAKFTQQALNLSPIQFPIPSALLYSPWRFGFLFQGHSGELSYLIGYTQLFVVFLSIYLITKNKFSKNIKSLLVFFLIIFVILILMMLPIAKPIWEATPFLKYSQFSTRLLVPLSLCISIIAGIVVTRVNKNWFIVILCFITIFYTILNWGNRRTIPEITDNYLKKEFQLRPDLTGLLELTSPIWADLNKSGIRMKPKLSIEILSGNATTETIFRTPTSHLYKISAESNVEIKENTLYFPGWIVIDNNNQIPINYKNPKFPGVITFNLSKGIHKLDVRFVDLPIITFSKRLSILAFFVMLVYIFVPKKLNFPKF